MFRPNPGWQDRLREQPEYADGLAKVAELARERADQFATGAQAPWMRRKGAAATVIVQRSGSTVRLVNTDYGGHLMEWGGRNNPPHAPLRRGIQAAGLRLSAI
ncbi:MAG: hypothetical protein H0W36_04130 [Gemmatimonadetes bacterium]|nr:hypothetical protein [Gemmatimonadota bacterium]